jgi:hypothetical protein
MTMELPTHGKSGAHATSDAAPRADTAEPSPITLERYVAISAELAGGEQAEVLARLGLHRDVWVAAMRDMAARFKAEPGLEERYRALMRERLGHGRR